MNFQQYKYLVLADLYRHFGNKRAKTLIKAIFFGAGFKFMFWLRSCRYCGQQRWLRYTLYPLTVLMMYRLMVRYSISIPVRTAIDSGFYIGHFGGIVVNADCVIGKNCNISQGVTLGEKNRGAYQGSPVIKDNVYIGPGAKVIGGITVGNNVAIGANCVVTKDVPDNAVVVGIPGRVISMAGSQGYVNNIDY